MASWSRESGKRCDCRAIRWFSDIHVIGMRNGYHSIERRFYVDYGAGYFCLEARGYLSVDLCVHRSKSILHPIRPNARCCTDLLALAALKVYHGPCKCINGIPRHAHLLLALLHG